MTAVVGLIALLFFQGRSVPRIGSLTWAGYVIGVFGISQILRAIVTTFLIRRDEANGSSRGGRH